MACRDVSSRGYDLMVLDLIERHGVTFLLDERTLRRLAREGLLVRSHTRWMLTDAGRTRLLGFDLPEN